MAGHVASQEAQELAEYWVVCLKAFEAWRARQHDFAAGADAVADLVAFAEPQGAPTGTSTVTPCRRGATYSCAPYSRIRTSCCHVADRGHCLLGDVGLRPRPGIAKQQAADPAPSGRTWTRPTLLAICIVQNPYRKIRPSNPECFRLA
jgi:hypothetical protein